MFTFDHLQMIKDKAHQCFDKANEYYGTKLDYPNVYVSGKMTKTAGLAHSMDNYIKISEPLFLQNTQDMLDTTVPHECAHIVANRIFKDDCGHDYRWQKVMKEVYGLEPERLHSYKTPPKRQVVKYVYQCGCRTWNFAPKRHSLASKGKRRYSCPKCKGKISYTGQQHAPHKTAEVVHHMRQTKDEHLLTQSGSISRPHGSKAQHARELFQQMKGQPRHEIVREFVAQVGLTPAGANTYYYNISKENQ